MRSTTVPAKLVHRIIVSTLLCFPAGAWCQTANTIASRVAHLDLRGSTRTVFASGADISHLGVHDTARVVIQAGARVAHATAYGDARIEIVGGQVSILTLNDGSAALLDDAIVAGGSHSGTAMGNVQIVLSSRSAIEFLATAFSFHNHEAHGSWRNGQRFGIAVGLNLGTDDLPRYTEAVTLPTQIRISTPPGPSSDCAVARSQAERTICANADLAGMDRQLAGLFSYAISQSEPQRTAAMRAAQRTWLRSRDKCAASGCVRELYRARLRELMAYTGDFDEPYGRTLCDQFVNAGKRAMLLAATSGSEDVNNDGTTERIEVCWSGTVNAPCTKYRNADGSELQVRSEGSWPGTRPYATLLSSAAA